MTAEDSPEEPAPCAFCGEPTRKQQIELPPKAIPMMKHSEQVDLSTVDSTVWIQLCADDWGLVKTMVTEYEENPIPEFDARHAQFETRNSRGNLTRAQQISDEWGLQTFAGGFNAGFDPDPDPETQALFEIKQIYAASAPPLTEEARRREQKELERTFNALDDSR